MPGIFTCTDVVTYCSLPVKFPKQRLQSTELTIGALEDKASSVRRYAIALLTKLILTHPYGLMHGGLLRIEEWEARYNVVSAELEQVENKEVKSAEEQDEDAEAESNEDEGEDEEEGEDEDNEMEDVETVLGSPSKAMLKATPARTPRARFVICLTVLSILLTREFRTRARSKSVVTPGFSEAEDEMAVDSENFAGMEESMEGDSLAFDGEMADPNEIPAKSVSSHARSSSVATATSARTPARRSTIPKTPGTMKLSAKKPKKTKKKKRRKTDALDLSTLTNEQTALAALESSQILHLKLRKRYYAEGLDFIRRVEGAMEILGQLLGSKNKPEVLEAMEFFRVAHEYQFTNAEVFSLCFFLKRSNHGRRLALRK